MDLFPDDRIIHRSERLPALERQALDQRQRQVADAIAAGPRGGVRGPFQALLRSPELCERTQRLGEYLRFDSIIPQRLRELAILATARHWRQNYEWQAHAPIAERAGIARELIAAIATGEPIEPHAADERIVLAFCRALHQRQGVDDATYAQALTLLGEPGVIELCGICGYYALLAMVLNVARTEVPAGSPGPFDAP